MEPSDSAAFISSKEGSLVPQSFECLVCREKFNTASLLSEHADSEHELSIDAEKLTDPNEDDTFLKFLRSMNIDAEYLKQREKYYPENSDHIHERIKIRIISQIKFASHSRAIEYNMQENDFKNTHHKGMNKET